MKKQLYLTFFFGLFAALTLHAQLQPGAWATPFRLADINGNEQRLYDHLAEGKPVIMVISAAWCAPCWSLHTSGVLDEVYDTYGPGGSDEIMVYFIEGDPGTSYAQLAGQLGPSQGNWIEGTPFPMIDVDNFLLPAAYGLQAYPTVIMICPDMRVKVPQMWSGISNWTVDYVLDQAFSCGEEALPAEDAAIHTFDIGNSSCYDGTIGAQLFNTGASPLTEAIVELRRDGQLLDTYNWSGNLETGQEATVVFEEVALEPGLNAFSMALAGEDADSSNNQVDIPFRKAPISSLELSVYVQGDDEAEDHNTRWEIVDEQGEVVESGALANSAYEEFTINLESEGCYRVLAYDDEGDGLKSGGFLLFTDENGTIIMDVGDFGSEASRLFLAQANISHTKATPGPHKWSVFPNPAKELLRVQFHLKEASEAKLMIRNAAGQLIKQRQINLAAAGQHQAEFGLAGLPAGLYQVQLVTNAGISARKILKQ